MDVFGYDVNDGDERDTPRRLSEASFVSTPDELRSLAEFLLFCAVEMETNPDFDHRHWRDHIGSQRGPFIGDIVIVRSR
jgi:hypothetical protein